MKSKENRVERVNQLHRQHTSSHHHHMRIRWQEFFANDNITPTKNAILAERSMVIGHTGIMLLSYKTGAWRTKSTMNTIARCLDMTYNIDIGLVSIKYACVDADGKNYIQTLSLPTTGVNTTKLDRMENFINQFKEDDGSWTIDQIHNHLEEVSTMKSRYSPWQVGLATGLAYGGFILLLDDRIFEVICALLGASCGNYIRHKMVDRHLTISADITVAVAIAYTAYVGSFYLIKLFYPVSLYHLDGYIGAMLFIIPGFPFITSGLDLSELDMRPDLERMVHAIMIIVVATAVGWVMALVLSLHLQNFGRLNLAPVVSTLLRLTASFCGVFDFSIMFNSKVSMVTVAGPSGAIASTLRLSLVNWSNVPPAVAAFIGAFVTGMLASIIRRKIGFPRTAITVPSIVIMVPGLYMYRTMFDLGLTSLNAGVLQMVQALMIVICLPLGLIAARILVDKDWRHAG